MSESKIFERSMGDEVDRLTRAGYDDVFSGEVGGIRGSKTGTLHRPEELLIEKIERFEGISNPEDESIVLAIVCKTHGCRGTFIAPFGKDMSSTDATWIRKIPDGRHPYPGTHQPGEGKRSP